MDPVVTSETRFSQLYLDLQRGFCCNDASSDKLIRWIGCTPAVYQGSKTVFNSTDIGLCTWFQDISAYSFQTVVLAPGATSTVLLDAEFLMLKVKWPLYDENNAAVLESMKLLEVGLNGQAGYVGQTIPFYIGAPDPPEYRYIIVKDLLIVNTKSSFTPGIFLNNFSTLEASVGVFAAK